MSDGVKKIFKIVISVPVIIFISYLIFNIFAFSTAYFKLLGYSYVVQQTAAENNYIPPEELASLNNYLNSLVGSTETIDNAKLVLVDNTRYQYGHKVVFRVEAHYRWIMPLQPKEQLQDVNSKFQGMSKTDTNMQYADDATLQDRRDYYTEDNKSVKKNNIIIEYTVPGLKYYADLE